MAIVTNLNENIIIMSTDLIKELRAKTHVSLNECKSALEEAGSVEGAIIVLQKRGLARAGEISSRITHEGKIFSYDHNGKYSVMVEVNCETDFAAKSPLFVEFGQNLAMHIAAFKPLVVSSSDLSKEDIDRQLGIFTGQVVEAAHSTGKPVKNLEKILEGKYKKWNTEICLLNQVWIHDSKKSVNDVRTELISSLGENISIRRFLRWEMGA